MTKQEIIEMIHRSDFEAVKRDTRLQRRHRIVSLSSSFKLVKYKCDVRIET